MSDRQPPRTPGNVVPLHDTKKASVELTRGEIEMLILQCHKVSLQGVTLDDVTIRAMGKLRNALKGL